MDENNHSDEIREKTRILLEKTQKEIDKILSLNRKEKKSSELKRSLKAARKINLKYEKWLIGIFTEFLPKDLVRDLFYEKQGSMEACAEWLKNNNYQFLAMSENRVGFGHDGKLLREFVPVKPEGKEKV